MVLPEISQNYGNYRYGNYVGNAHSRWGNYRIDRKTARGSVNIVKMTGSESNDQLCAYKY